MSANGGRFNHGALFKAHGIGKDHQAVDGHHEIILGHAGAKDYYYFKVINMIKKNKGKNIFVDISGDILYRGMLELFVEELGSSKILFGTDSPWTDPLLTVLYVLDSKISAEDKENIFYNNAAALFNI